jgi:hypothetical protein
VRCAEPIQQIRRECRGDVDLPRRDGTEDGDELTPGHAFQDIGLRARVQSRCHIVFLFRDRKHDCLDDREALRNVLDRGKPAPWHREIEQHDIWQKLSRDEHRLVRRRTLRHHLDVGISAQNMRHAFPKQRMVVNDGDVQLPVHEPLQFRRRLPKVEEPR